MRPPYKFLLGVFCLLLIALQSSSQIQELKRKLDTTHVDSSRVKVLASLGFNYAFVDLDTSRRYSNMALELSRKIQYRQGEARALNNLAISYDIAADYENSIQLFLQALALYEAIGDKKGVANVYTNCGLAYQNMQNLDQSLNFHHKALDIEMQLNDSLGMAYTLLHIAGISQQKANYDDARVHYLRSDRILDSMGMTAERRYVFIGVGELYLRTNQLDKALIELNRALPLFESTKDKRGMAQSILLIAEAYEKQENFEQSEQNYFRAMEIAESLKADHIVLEGYRKISGMYESWGQLAKSLSFYKKYKIQEDSVLNQQKSIKIQELEYAYEVDKKEQEILLLNQEHAYTRLIRNITIGVLFASLCFTFFVLRLYKFKKNALKVLEDKNKLIERKNFIIQVEKQNALQASEAKAQFLSNMSHEIRTPLNAIIGLTHLLEDDTTNLDQRENLQGLKFSSQNLLALVNDILDFSKIESGKVEFNNVRFSLAELYSNIRQLFQPLIDKKDLKFRIKLDDEVPSTLIGDPSKLSQVLTNLVNNAIKFTNEGTITLDVSFISKVKEQIILEFSVQDTGIGIPIAHQKKIFRSFSQADSKISETYGGTGLGLAIVKKLLQQKGCEIYVESQVDKGSRFFFQMPFKLGSKADFVSQQKPTATFKSLRGLKILLVEDNKVNEMLGVKLLTKWNIKVDVAQNGLQAVEMVQMKKYDIILMDIQMPEMDGYEAAVTIRKMDGEVYQHLPIIAITASATKEAKYKILQSGMNDYLYKPYNPNDLYLKIEQYALIGASIKSIQDSQEEPTSD